jgi:F-type H+-transporting ATPase subunit a
MMSGHILLKILIKLVWSITTAGSLWMILSYAPLGLIFCVTGLECMVACLQTYIFFVLLSLYLNDVINLH